MNLSPEWLQESILSSQSAIALRHTMKLCIISLLLVILASLTASQRVSAPECTDGSSASCVCGDGSEPNYSKFPPCELKKVIFHVSVDN